MRVWLRRTATSFLASAVAAGALSAQVTSKWTDVNPNRSTLDVSDPDGASGGRVNGLGRSANASELYAATEMGGLYKSTDAGQTWRHIDGHLPTVTWDVKVDPANSKKVYATSWYDGRVASLAGISVSSDAGATWTRPASAVPPTGFCDGADRRDNPSAFGIAIDPANTDRVLVGTNCGLAISTNAGSTWSFVDPTPADPADDVWDVIVHHGGIIDVCGDDGHRRSTDGGATWTTTTPLLSGRCSLAVSPDEAYVLISVVGTTIRESDNGGITWPTTLTNPGAQGRIPFVATNDRTGSAFDLWFGDTRLDRATCTTPGTPATGGAARCPINAWTGPFTRDGGTCVVANCAHDDAGDILFASAAVDACPLLFSSDGGVYRNVISVSPGCHTPQWEQPRVTPHALRTYAMAGVDEPGEEAEDLYVGAQDNGSFGTTGAGATMPTWWNRECCDAHNIVASSTRVMYSICCGTTIFVRNPGMVGGGVITNAPPGGLGGFRYGDALAQYGPSSYVAVTGSGVYVTTNTGATAWTQLGAASSPASPQNVWVATAGGTPTFFVQTGNANGQTADPVFRFVGTGAGSWQRVSPPGGTGGFGVFTVDPVNPNRLFASHLQARANPVMVMSIDGGTTWTGMPALDNLMTGGGVFNYQNRRGPASRGGTATVAHVGYPMPTLVAFDSVESNVMIAGGAESGVFLSANGGTSWELITDPINPAASGTPHLPRPVFAYVDHRPWTLWNSILNPTLTMYVGTDGRGVWRFTRSRRFPLTTLCGIRLEKCIEARLDRGKITLDCATDPRHCVFVDFVPKNCTIKFTCPGCMQGFCPPFYHLFLDDLDLRTWEVGLFGRDGEPVPHDIIKTQTGVVVSFRPSKEMYQEGSIGNYVLAFAMRAGGKPGRYVIPARLATGNSPYTAVRPGGG